MEIHYKKVSEEGGLTVSTALMMWYDWKRIKHYSDLSIEGFETVMYWMPTEYVMCKVQDLTVFEMRKGEANLYQCSSKEVLRGVLFKIAERLKPRYLGKAKEVLSFSSEVVSYFIL